MAMKTCYLAKNHQVCGKPSNDRKCGFILDVDNMVYTAKFLNSEQFQPNLAPDVLCERVYQYLREERDDLFGYKQLIVEVSKARFDFDNMEQSLGHNGNKLGVKMFGDILFDLRTIFGPSLRFTVEITKFGVKENVELTANQYNADYSSMAQYLNHSPAMLMPMAPPDRKRLRVLSQNKVTTGAMSIVLKTGIGAYCADTVKFPTAWRDSWLLLREKSKLMVEVNILMSVDEENQNDVDNGIGTVTNLNRKLLQEEIQTDLEIVTKTGSVVKCYSGFLIAQSEVFERMLGPCNEMKEAQTNRIRMDDASEGCVRAFMAYLYYRDLKIARDCCQIAVELLNTARKYLIEQLEVELKDILMTQPKDWFQVDATISLFFFAAKVDHHKDLKKKALSILKIKRRELKDSVLYAELFTEHPQAAKEISLAFLEPK